jgi:hypothetical protein
MKTWLTLLWIGVLMCSSLMAQEYSYFTDRRFSDITDLVGYTFVPNEKQLKGDDKMDIQAGAYSFSISSNYLYVKGNGIEGSYSINQFDPTDYGYKLLLMNARDPMIQGHLKVILAKGDFVDALIFKRETSSPEIIFYQPELPADLKKKESTYFTDLGELAIPYADSIWGTVIRPMHRNEDRQMRLRIQDSVSLEFVKTITLEGKKQKEVVKYSMKLRYMEKVDDGGDGFTKEKIVEFPIKDWSRKTNQVADAIFDKHLLRYRTESGSSIEIYLAEDDTITEVHLLGAIFLMRGR